MKRTFLVIAGVSLLLAGTAWAAGGPAKEGWDAWKQVVYQAINLAILLWLIVKFAGPSVSAALKGRTQQVTQDIDEAAKLHAEAQAMLDEYGALLAGFEARSTELLEDYRAIGQAERDRLIEEARVEAERIRAEASRLADNEVARARERLEAEIVDLAVAKAEGMIRDQLSDDDHHRLITEYFGQLETSVSAE